MKKPFVTLLILFATTFVPSMAGAKSTVPHFDFEKRTKINTYDNQMILAAQIAESAARKRSHRRCWRAVKTAMLEANVLPDRPTSRYAKEAGDELEQKFGFKKIDITNPFDAPIGSVLVYGGRGAGHVEIRTADGFVSDHISPRPSRRPLLGVYVRV